MVDTKFKEDTKVLLNDFFDAIGCAILHFREINHWKGLAYAYKLVSEVSQENRVATE